MNILLPAGLALALSATPFALPGAINAAGIQRCDAADGSRMYTDRACSSIGGKAAPLPAEVLALIARDASSTPFPDHLVRDAGTPTVIASRRSPQSGCARTPTQLTMDLQGSYALGDVNRLAESVHWVDQSHRQARQLMHRLEGLVEQSLLDASFHSARIGSEPVQFTGIGPANGSIGMIQLSLADAARTEIIDVEVLHYSGCYFIRF